MAQSAAEQSRVDRLSALCRLWGMAKFMHPVLASGEVDWDSALTRAIPKVSASRNVSEFRAAIEGMLRELDDPWTRTLVCSASSGAQSPIASSTAGTPPPAFSEKDGVVMIDGSAMTGLQLRQASPYEFVEVAGRLVQSIAMARAVVFDLRFPAHGDVVLAFFMRQFALATVARLVRGTVPLGSMRVRQHHGYMSHDPMIRLGPYSSGLVTATPETLTGQRTSGGDLADALVLSDHIPLVVDLAVGLQAAGLGHVLVETREIAFSDLGLIDSEGPIGATYGRYIPLHDGVIAHLRVADVVGPDGSIGFTPDVRVASTRNGEADPALEAAHKIVLGPRVRGMKQSKTVPTLPPIAPDDAYVENALPDREHRLLGLFRLWSVIQYFFPYVDLMDRPWDQALAEFIPRFEASGTVLDYQLALMEMATRLQDSHVRVGNASAVEEHIGTHTPPLSVSEIEGQTVVTALRDPSTSQGIMFGDVVVAIDDEPVDRRRARWQQITPASTPQSLRRSERMILRGPKGSIAKLRIKDAAGGLSEVSIARSLDWNASGGAWQSYRKPLDVFCLLPSGYGYVDLSSLQLSQLDAALALAFKAPAIIFDMRGYPNLTGFLIAPRLARQPPVRPIIGALFLRPFLDGGLHGKLRSEQRLLPTDKPRYQGDVVMLINHSAISQAEHTCKMFAAATNVTFVGSPTAGASGDVTAMVLPGNLVVYFTGQEIRFADGRQFQRIGILPHVPATPTIDGIRAGRDEVLEAAVAHLDKASTGEKATR